MKQFDLPSFHMSDFAQSTEMFMTWKGDESKRQMCFSMLLGIINRHAIGSVGTVIPVKAYKQVISSEADAFVGGPYGLAASMCALSLSNVLHLTKAIGNVHYIFEAGGLGWGQLQKLFQLHLKTPGGRYAMRLSGIQVAAKPEFAPLQAADILAYELYKGLPRQLGIDPLAQRRYPQRMLRQIPSCWSCLDAVGLHDIGEVIEARIAWDKKGDDWWTPDDRARSVGPAIAISIEEFQRRWRWVAQFRKEGTLLGANKGG